MGVGARGVGARGAGDLVGALGANEGPAVEVAGDCAGVGARGGMGGGTLTGRGANCGDAVVEDSMDSIPRGEAAGCGGAGLSASVVGGALEGEGGGGG